MDRTAYAREASWLLEEKHQGKRTKEAEQDLKRLAKGEPVDYLIGFVEFAGCVIDLSSRPLIPRPETEHWTMKAIQELKTDTRKSFHCLDMFAGSGCVGVAVLHHLPQALVDFAEQDKRLLGQIRLNLEKNGLSARRSRLFHSDVFSSVPGNYDYIFANPPYIPESGRQKIQASVLQYEPAEALFAGRDGLEYIKRFLKEAKAHLNPEGRIYMEFDPIQRREIGEIAGKLGYKSCEFSKDQYGKWRWCRMGS